MRTEIRVLAAFVLVLCLAAGASAQFGVQRPPQFRGVWSPVVGSGGAYVSENKEGKTEMEIAIVGTESAEGKTGHWMEMTVKDKSEGQVVTKFLMVLDAKDVVIKRMIIQAGDQPPMEMPVGMVGARGKSNESADFRDQAELVGTETITTPAGTFTCQHYRAKDKSADLWVAEKVGPWGLVKMTSRDGSTTLVRVITNAKSKIRGTPQKFEIPAMPPPE